MQKTLSSTQLKEMLASDSNPYQNHEDITLNMSGENKNDQELNAEIIEKYFAENSGSNTDPSSGEKYVDDDDFDDTHTKNRIKKTSHSMKASMNNQTTPTRTKCKTLWQAPCAEMLKTCSA
jgi:hypothetical protein